MVIISVFQTDDVGSIPITCSIEARVGKLALELSQSPVCRDNRGLKNALYMAPSSKEGHQPLKLEM